MGWDGLRGCGICSCCVVCVVWYQRLLCVPRSHDLSPALSALVMRRSASLSSLEALAAASAPRGSRYLSTSSGLTVSTESGARADADDEEEALAEALLLLLLLLLLVLVEVAVVEVVVVMVASFPCSCPASRDNSRGFTHSTMHSLPALPPAVERTTIAVCAA